MQREGEITFARKASGLVRGLSFWDAFGIGFMNQGLTPSIWVMISLGLGVYLGGNLIIATILSVVMVGIGFPIIWGVLGGSMPRSGGEYIYNSRILHPLLGIGESFGNAFIWLMWIYVLAPWMADPGAVMLSQFMGWEWLYNPETETFLGGLSYSWGAFVIASIASVIAFSLVAFGIKIFARAQKVVMTLGLLGTMVIVVVLFMYSKQDFVTAWNTMAAEHGSLSYDEFITAAGAAAGTAMPTTWNWSDTLGVMVAGSWLFAYSYCITFIAGEVKRPDKTIMFSNLWAIIVPGVFMILVAIGLYRLVDFDFLSASAWVDNNGGIEGYNMPFSSHFVGLAAVVMHNKILLFLMALSFILFCLWWVALSYLAFPRIIFAWGMDRMGPKWFTDVNARFASPIKNYILCLLLGEALIALYVFWQNEHMQGLSVTALEIFSVFGVTAIAAAVFPFSKRAKHIWEASPYRRWKLFGVPVVTLGAVVAIAYLVLLAVYFFIMPTNLEGFTFTTGMLILGTWVLGIAWYFFWTWRTKRTAGISTGMLTGELPPE
ncbi:MAG: APC family permease [Actinobacteria bacterium]|nr:APC family permease [Actinomycetota bacterium]